MSQSFTESWFCGNDCPGMSIDSIIQDINDNIDLHQHALACDYKYRSKCTCMWRTGMSNEGLCIKD